jgi:integrase
MSTASTNATPKIPEIRFHKGNGSAYVYVRGKVQYLGAARQDERRKKNGRPLVILTAAGRAKYKQVIDDLLGGSTVVGPGRPDMASHFAPARAPGLSVVELADAYFDYAADRYQKEGKPTGHFGKVRIAVGLLDERFGDLAAAEFRPKHLRQLQCELAAQGYARSYVDDLVNAARSAFKWAAREELIPGSLVHDLECVQAVEPGRTAAREPSGKEPVPDKTVEETLPHLPRIVADMIRFHRCVGCRPSEVCIIRPCDIDRCGDVWLYRPTRHKAQHLGHDRVLPVGPKAQDVLRPYLLRSAEVFCFVPAESTRRGKPGTRYTKDSYANAIAKACRKAFPAPAGLTKQEKLAWHKAHRWSPIQLRKALGTEARDEYGLDGAQALMGHKHASTTEIYAKLRLQRAIEIAMKIG